MIYKKMTHEEYLSYREKCKNEIENKNNIDATMCLYRRISIEPRTKKLFMTYKYAIEYIRIHKYDTAAGITIPRKNRPFIIAKTFRIEIDRPSGYYEASCNQEIDAVVDIYRKKHCINCHKEVRYS